MQANRPLPSSVDRAVLFMRVGAGLAIANGLVTALLGVLGWHHNPQAAYTGSSSRSAFEAGYVIASALWFLLPAGLWFWMAHANKAGKSWARITGTVFFGVSCVLVLASFSVDTLSSAGLSGAWALVPLLVSLLNWILGLFTVILLWNKKSAPHFASALMPYPASYRPAPLPNTTVAAAVPPHPAADPWRVPDGQASST
ncbi:hypothetical protein KDK95_33275 [Actinospica sp. MGRD01-02]|uniref:Uncharacterized protein n=1 Tax=Actinospica acidithermotolerans TaxID=2828514 RepID=A0A941EGW1_9ACTN|nr:hypothetical protein [Actinospica acidithermotolerans]MBR7831226.1 hypothetical protein [Actinospica acidithermotolerans]